MGLYLDSKEEEAKVNRSRHGTTSDTPIAWSVPQLIKDVVQHAASSTPLTEITADEIPSEEWVRLSFSPSNPWIKTSAAYTCRFDLHFKVLSRGATTDHPDGAYAARILKYWKHLACELKGKLRDGQRVAVKADDKCSAKVGEPRDGVSALERNREVIMSGASEPSASRHDFTWAKVNISVLLVVDVLNSAEESFYRGSVYTSVKDALIEGSTALRHSTEWKRIFKQSYPEMCALLIYTDGGPDHNVTFLKTILALITLFLALDLDFLVAARTCPNMSWKNAVEKIMYILNLAMYGCVLVRDSMPANTEALRKQAGGSVDAIRKKIRSGCTDLSTAILESTAPVKQLLQSRFGKLALKGVAFQGGHIATHDEMFEMLALVTIIEPKITGTEACKDLPSSVLRTMTGLQKWIEVHVTQRSYHMVIGKYCQCAGGEKCAACKPVRMDSQVWDELSRRSPLLLDPEPSAIPEKKGK